MPCYHPLPAWYCREKNASGKRSITFSPGSGTHGTLQVPCGTCIGCKLERARQWAMRCMHEASLWDDNVFVTLTYDDEHLPPGGSLVPEHYVLFMKKLRYYYGNGIRFFHCGEYGEKLGRPHHHALLFNLDFPDKVLLPREGVNPLYRSPSLDSIWGHGFASIGAVSFESAGYIARYTLKKVVGPGASEHYANRVPEYLTMSRKPGIGRGWIDKFGAGVYRDDSCIVNGAECKPPRYYDNVAEVVRPSVMKKIRYRRARDAASSDDNSGKRLLVREAVKKAAVSTLTREL